MTPKTLLTWKRSTLTYVNFTKTFLKKERDKRFVKNWQPISLLNVNIKILSKSLAEKLTHNLPELISSNHTTYVKNWCINESGRLISNVIEMYDVLDILGYPVTVDIEKAFDSLDHDFLLFKKKLVFVKISFIGYKYY